jgi:S-formylglutathione hydrolase FrmB
MMRLSGRRVVAAVIAAAVLTILQGSALRAAEPLRFDVRMEAGVAKEPISGRLFVFLSKREWGEPRFGPSWFGPEPFFGLNVEKFQPGTSRVIDDRADGFPARLSGLPRGKYRVQALLDHDFYCPQPAAGEGNLFSDARTAELDPASSGTIELALNQVVKPTPFPESKWVKEIVVRSESLSKFHGRDVIERAAVALPASYFDQPQRRYPTVYLVPGFGGSHRDLARGYLAGPGKPSEGEVEFIRVLLSGQCKWGHHAYANSETNGPRGDALVREMIPQIDRDFRTIAAPTARFVTGHSSGGWSSLWLQVAYTDTFGGVWSIAPDPVDFRNFSGIDVYAQPPPGMYSDPQGSRRPIARRGTEPVLWMEAFCRMDDVLGRGGQMRSFEAVFSPRGPDGLPRRLWDRPTGRIDPEVARSWRKYDIRLVLEENWPVLGPKLRGKLHIVTGELDTFYLEGAVRLLAEGLRKLGSDARIEIVPGADHGSVLRNDLMGRIRREMGEVFLENHPQPAAPRAVKPAPAAGTAPGKAA